MATIFSIYTRAALTDFFETLKPCGRTTLVARLKRILKIGALCLGALLAICLIGNAVAIWSTGSRLEARLAEIRQAGDPVTLPDLNRPAPPPDRNAATFLGRGREALVSLARQLNQVDDRFKDTKDRPGEEEQKALRNSFDGYPQVFPLLEQAAACPEYTPQLDYMVNPTAFTNQMINEAQDLRDATNIVMARSRLLRAQGKRDAALNACLMSLRLTRLSAPGPTVICYLAVCACRAIAIAEINLLLRTGPVSAHLQSELERELTISGDQIAYQQVLKGERAFGVSAFAAMGLGMWPIRPFFTNDMCFYLDQMKEQIDLATRPYAEAFAAEVEIKRQLMSGGARTLHPMSALVLPALMKTRDAHERILAQLRCLRVLNAIQMHGARSGQEIGLAELGLPADATLDPYDGSPIKLKRVDGDWLIYCVGPNLKDDGGKLEKHEDIGIGPKRLMKD
jgi:hypothetical protein